MQKKIRNYIKEYQMLHYGDRLVIGVSGGADSVCLLRLLCELSKEYGLTLFPVHVNHGLRGEEAKRDEAFVVSLCEKLGLSCRVVCYPVRKEAKRLGCGEEEAGRELRYRAFREEAKRQGCTKVAVAHHIEDNAETLLFRLFRGTGIHGLAGISPIGSLQADQSITLLRPLLCVSRTQIEAYLSAIGQEYCIDSTNANVNYSRNRIRNELLPIAAYINPAAVQNINALALRARAVTDYLERQASKVYRTCVKREGQKLSLTLAEEEEPVLLELVFRNCLYELAGRKQEILSVHIEALCELLRKQVGSSLDLPYGICAKRTYTGITMQRASAEGTEDVPENGEPETNRSICLSEEELFGGITVTMPQNKGRLHLHVKLMQAFEPDFYRKNAKTTQSDYTKCFDYDKIKDSISIRTPQSSDFLCVYPDGRKKPLKDYLKDRKLPKEERGRLCVIAEGASVLWIPGLRTGENRRISEETERVLVIEWIQ